MGRKRDNYGLDEYKLVKCLPIFCVTRRSRTDDTDWGFFETVAMFCIMWREWPFHCTRMFDCPDDVLNTKKVRTMMMLLDANN